LSFDLAGLRSSGQANGIQFWVCRTNSTILSTLVYSAWYYPHSHGYETVQERQERSGTSCSPVGSLCFWETYCLHLQCTSEEGWRHHICPWHWLPPVRLNSATNLKITI
jgi:hypothetical protein